MAAANDLTNPPPQHRKHRKWRSRLTGPVFVVILVGAGGSGYRAWKNADKAADAKKNATTVTVPTALDTPVGAPFPVQTDGFSFVMPATPLITPLSEYDLGPGMNGTQWTVESSTVSMSIVAFSTGEAVDEATQHAAFDAGIAGIAEEIKGTVVSDTWTTIDGVYQRDAVISSLSGKMTVKGYGKGPWFVFIGGLSINPAADAAYANLLASFVFV